MEPMNNFVRNSRPVVENFLDQITDVGEPEDSLGYFEACDLKIEHYRGVIVPVGQMGELVKMLKEFSIKLVIKKKMITNKKNK